MNKKTNVLIFPAGEINSIELHDALSFNVNIEVFGASSVERHGSYVFKNYKGNLPFISDGNFISEFNRLIDEWKIDFVFPTHDTVAMFLAEKQEQLKAKVIVASVETARICRDKRETYNLFKQYDFCPEIYKSIEKYPCFIKPRAGQGSVGAKKIVSEIDIPEEINLDDYVITEYLPGKELTVDCLTDSHGNLCAVLPRVRTRLMAGVSVAGYAIAETDEIREIAERINYSMNFLGLWYFQLKQDATGRYKLLEVSVRCAGTMCLSRARGVNLPLLSVYVAQGKDVAVFENPYSIKMDRTLITRYQIDYEYDTVYIDYDDTLVSQQKVCLPAIRFVYQCKNKNKKVILITRHNQDHDNSVYDDLGRHFIAEALFDEIINVEIGKEKNDYIRPEKAIFIDNAFAERKKVHNKYKIPVFDVEGLEVLCEDIS